MMQRSCSGSLYELLEVEKSATPQELKKSYYRLALRFHPDKTNGATEEQFKLIQEAYFVLSDQKRRSIYNQFGKSGLDALSKLDDVNLPVTSTLVRAFFFLSAFWASLLLLALELVIVRLDYKKQWRWPFVFIPLWVALLPVLLIGVILLRHGLVQRDISIVFIGSECVMLIVAAATFVSGLSGAIAWTTALAPSVALCALDTCSLMRQVIYSIWHHPSRNVDAGTSRCLSQPFCGIATRMLFRTLCLFAFFILAMLRAAQGDEEEENKLISFWEVFAPLIVYFGSMALVSAAFDFFATSSGRQRGFLLRLCSSTFSAMWYGSLLFMACMIAAKCDAEQNHKTTGLHPSAAVALIPLQVILALAVVVPCCLSCLSLEALNAWDTGVAGESGETIPLFKDDNKGGNGSTPNQSGVGAARDAGTCKLNRLSHAEDPTPPCRVPMAADDSTAKTPYRKV